MKDQAWPTSSVTEMLRPADGWKVDHAILTTYSADLAVIVTALLALSGCDLDHRRTGSRVELVRAVDKLRGRVRVLAQANRVTVPRISHLQPILKLLDRFLNVVVTNEADHSWHPKISLVRFVRSSDSTDFQWRLWIGSRNLTHPMNWEAGLNLTSRADGKGQKVPGLSRLAAELATRAGLSDLSAHDVSREMERLTWECPPGCKLQQLSLLGPGVTQGFPRPRSDTEQVIVLSPFLDAPTVREIAAWGNPATKRTLVSSRMEFERLVRAHPDIFRGFEKKSLLPPPEYPADETNPDASASDPIEKTESEGAPPAGLHAKLFLAMTSTERRLWIGSANATQRGWSGRNFEAVAELLIGRDSAGALQDFALRGEPFTPLASPPEKDPDEEALEEARRRLSTSWPLEQNVVAAEVLVVAPAPPVFDHRGVRLEIAPLGGRWTPWPENADRILLPIPARTQRSDFVQVRLLCGKKRCAWLQLAPCNPRPDNDRDRALVAEFLDPRSFLLLLKSELNDEAASEDDDFWDGGDHEEGDPHRKKSNRWRPLEPGLLPSVEEILRAWARDNAAFVSANEKVNSYLQQLERVAIAGERREDAELLRKFRDTWTTIAEGLK